MAPKEMVAVRLQHDVKKKLTLRARQHNRTVTNQLESYINIALIAEDNPDLPFSFIEDILAAEEERKAGMGAPFEIKAKK